MTGLLVRKGKMLKTLFTAIGALTAVTLAPSFDASARTFDFTYADGVETLDGQFSIDAQNEVTAMSGSIVGPIDDTIFNVYASASFPGNATSPDGLFYYNNVFYPGSDPAFDNSGVLFTSIGNASGYWNLFSYGPGNYTLWESKGGGWAYEGGQGTLTLSAPEPSTWAMMLLGLAGLTLAGSLKLPRFDGRVGA
jgi:PEP-CTERM motif